MQASEDCKKLRASFENVENLFVDPRQGKDLNHKNEIVKFLHIPKNAGETVGRANKQRTRYAAHHGDCHNASFNSFCKVNTACKCSAWHVAPRYQSPSPYDGTATFCMARDPLDKALSQWKMEFLTKFETKFPNATMDETGEIAGKWMKHTLEKEAEALYRGMYDCHMLAQHEYIWDANGVRTCDNVLRIEDGDLFHRVQDLSSEFTEQSGMYKYLESMNGSLHHNPTTLGVEHIPTDVAQFVRQFYWQDMCLLGYDTTLSAPPANVPSYNNPYNNCGTKKEVLQGTISTSCKALRESYGMSTDPNDADAIRKDIFADLSVLRQDPDSTLHFLDTTVLDEFRLTGEGTQIDDEAYNRGLQYGNCSANVFNAQCRHNPACHVKKENRNTIPPRYFSPLDNPYTSAADAGTTVVDEKKKKKKTFCVVSDPAQKIVSTLKTFFRKPSRSPMDAKLRLNTFATTQFDQIHSAEHWYKLEAVEWPEWLLVSQSEFLFDADGKKTCDYVLRYEDGDVKGQIQKLLKAFPASSDKFQFQHSHSESPISKLTLDDLLPYNRDTIRQIYWEDSCLLGYDMTIERYTDQNDFNIVLNPKQYYNPTANCSESTILPDTRALSDGAGVNSITSSSSYLRPSSCSDPIQPISPNGYLVLSSTCGFVAAGIVVIAFLLLLQRLLYVVHK